MLISNLLLPLFLTILIEGAFAYMVGFRDRKSLLAIAAVNGITNPSINLIAMLIIYYGYGSLFYWFILLLELLVIPMEWFLLSYALSVKKTRLFMLSASMNPISFMVGFLILQ